MPAIDLNAQNFAGLESPASGGVVVTPSDSTDLVNESRAVWVGGAGTLTVTMADGVAVLLSGIAAGTLLPIRCTRVKSTGTTATLIVNLY